MTALAAYRVRARNTSAQSENRIHDDDVARRYGFAGGLVPGVAVYAYATYPIVQALGPAWLERGRASVRFTKPVLEGEEVMVTGEHAGSAGRQTVTVVVRNGRGEECARATAEVGPEPPVPLDVAGYPAAPLPETRPEASPESLAVGRVLGSPAVAYDEPCATGFIDGVRDPDPRYRGVTGLVHPAFCLHQANRALSQNVRLSPWIHVGSEIEHVGLGHVGDRLVMRGRVAELAEKKGRELVTLDLLLVSEPGDRPLARVRHAAIWRLPVPA